MTATRRRFNRSERNALYLAGAGRCALCGDDLSVGWHADHVLPFSRGGATDVVNGQALCPACNLSKGDTVVEDGRWPQDFVLRGWQRRAYEEYVRLKLRSFFCEATPGAGKTSWALYVASRSLLMGETRRVVVVVPTDHLRKQWLAAAARFGIQLDDSFTNQMKDGEARDYDGVVVTYAQVASNPTLHRALCGKDDTFVILDEPHHAGQTKSWGDQTQHAFEPAKRLLLISGTPFRSDSALIPFGDYRDGKLQIHSRYSYEEAVRHKVCRQVYFPSFEGELRWYSEQTGEVTATFADTLSEEAARRRLDTALDPNGDWLHTVLGEADKRLLDVREHIYADAAGLVIANDQYHAQAICKLLYRITGEEPALAISDDPTASRVIEDFGNTPSPEDYLAPVPKRWIVAVKMVSEGVDIPRLFVGVYATKTMTELFFRQAVGRFVRMLPDVPGQAAYVFIPKDETLVGYAQSIKEEREHAILAAEEDAERERQQRLLDAERTASTFTALGATAHPDAVIFDGDVFSQSEVRDGRRFLVAAGLETRQLSDVEVARLYRVMRDALTVDRTAESSSTTAPAQKPLRVIKDELRADVKNLASRLVGLAGRGYMQNVFDFKFVWGLLNHATQTTQGAATEEQLHRRKAVLQGWIELAIAVDVPMSEPEWWKEANDARQQAA